MGIGGINIWQLLILLLVIILVFGTNKLRNLGADLGSALKGFRNAMRDGEETDGVIKEGKVESDANRAVDGQSNAKNSPKNHG